jgi:hypothetical protein
VVDGEEEDNPQWPKQWVMTENKSSSWCMKNTMDLRGTKRRSEICPYVYKPEL